MLAARSAGFWSWGMQIRYPHTSLCDLGSQSPYPYLVMMLSGSLQMYTLSLGILTARWQALRGSMNTLLPSFDLVGSTTLSAVRSVRNAAPNGSSFPLAQVSFVMVKLRFGPGAASVANPKNSRGEP